MLNLQKNGYEKQYVSLFAIILSVSGFLFSCHDKMNKTQVRYSLIAFK